MYLFYFEKGESVRWLGHLDILRAFERALRRAELPVAFTQGYNPRIKIGFASALSTGITGSAEPAAIELTEDLPAEEVKARLNAVLPPGLQIGGCMRADETGRKDLLNRFDHAEYTFVSATPSAASGQAAALAAERVMAQANLWIEREREGRTRRIDIRPLISYLRFEGVDVETGRQSWRTVVSIGENGNVRPADLVAALSETVPGITLRRAHRVRLLTSLEARAEERPSSTDHIDQEGRESGCRKR